MSFRSILIVCITLGLAVAQPAWAELPSPLEIGVSGGLRVVAVHPGPDARATTARADAADTTSTILSHPRPPLAGFSPLLVVTTSNSRQTGEFEWEHILRQGYVGQALNPPANANYAIGLFDSGSTADLFGHCVAGTLGLSGTYLTSNTVTLGGASGEVEAVVSQPLGVFAAGFEAVGSDGILDLNQVVGHTNVATVVLPPEPCDGPSIPAVIGQPLLAFYTTVIRNDSPQRILVDGEPVVSPAVQMRDRNDPSLPVYPRSIAMNFSGSGGLPVTSASYYPDEDFITPLFPTLLAFSYLPVQGGFFSTMGALTGEPSPINPIQNLRMLVDTGAQASILTPGAAANLNLDLQNPHFMVEVLGIGGIMEMPGFYVDYIRINASGGAFEFSHAPFVVIQLDSPDGGQMDGVLGMNLFWNRNVVFAPSLSGSGFLHASNVIPRPYGDFNHDYAVDEDDLAIFMSCVSGPAVSQPPYPHIDPLCIHADADGDGDVDADDFGRFQACFSGHGVIADPQCGS